MRQTPASHHSLNPSAWVAPTAGFLIWAAATASLVAWGLAFWPQDGQPPASSVVMGQGKSLSTVVSSADLVKVLGGSNTDAAQPPAPSLASRLVLVGIAKRGQEISALIAVDGQAAKPFAKGREVLPGLVLQSVSLQQAQLGSSVGGPSQLSLEMPKRSEPATGMVP